LPDGHCRNNLSFEWQDERPKVGHIEVNSSKILIIKANETHYFSNLFDKVFYTPIYRYPQSKQK